MIPEAPEHERGLISTMLQGGSRTIGDIVAEIGMEPNGLFSVPGNGKLFRAIIEAWKEGEPIQDVVAFTGILQKRGYGSRADLTPLYYVAGSPHVWKTYVEELRDQYWLRTCLQIGTEIKDLASQENADAQTVMERTEYALLHLASKRIRTGSKSIRQIVDDVIDHMRADHAITLR